MNRIPSPDNRGNQLSPFLQTGRAILIGLALTGAVCGVDYVGDKLHDVGEALQVRQGNALILRAALFDNSPKVDIDGDGSIIVLDESVFEDY